MTGDWFVSFDLPDEGRRDRVGPMTLSSARRCAESLDMCGSAKLLIEDARGWAWGGCGSKFVSALPELLPIRWWRAAADRWRAPWVAPEKPPIFDIDQIPAEERDAELEAMAFGSRDVGYESQFMAIETDPIEDIKSVLRSYADLV